MGRATLIALVAVAAWPAAARAGVEDRFDPFVVVYALTFGCCGATGFVILAFVALYPLLRRGDRDETGPQPAPPGDPK